VNHHEGVGNGLAYRSDGKVMEYSGMLLMIEGTVLDVLAELLGGFREVSIDGYTHIVLGYISAPPFLFLSISAGVWMGDEGLRLTSATVLTWGV
jgi:hypothetical protein